jgi:hypothetical protein
MLKVRGVGDNMLKFKDGFYFALGWFTAALTIAAATGLLTALFLILWSLF